MTRTVTSSLDRRTLAALVGVLVTVLVAVALVPSPPASALPPVQPAKPTGEPTELPEDLAPPEISFPMPGGGVNGWFSGTTVLTVSATDKGANATGVTSFSYTLSGAMSGNGSLKAAGDTIAVTAGGQTTVTLYAEDGNGNPASAQRVIGVDRDMPTLTIETPTHDQRFVKGSIVQSTYLCNDVLTGIKACSSSQPTLDTATTGAKSVTFTATDNVGNTRSQTVSYQVIDDVFTRTASPAITGTAMFGSTLTVVPGSYTPEPANRAYQWYRDGEIVLGATATSYTPGVHDIGRTITVYEFVSGDGMQTLHSGANGVGPVQPQSFTEVVPPTITGVARIGETLTAGPGELDPTPSSVTYRWLRDGTPIAGATTSTYRVVAADATHRIRAEITAKRDGFADRVVLTAATAAVPAPPGTGGTKGPGVPGGAAKTAGTVAAKVKALKKRKARVTVTVTAGGRPVSGGTVTVRNRAKVLASGVKVAAGRAVVTVKKLPKGKKVRLSVRYSGSADVTAASTRTRRIAVR